MIKKITKIVAGIATTAALLFVAGCKNQADYVDDTTARNAFNVAGVYLSGFDAYNLKTATLHIVTDDTDSDADVEFSLTVADVNSDNIPYLSGTAYKTADIVYDGDALAQAYYKNHKDDVDSDGKSTYSPFAATKMEMYLVIDGTTFQVWNDDYTKLENATVTIPTAAADASDSELDSRWIAIQYGAAQAIQVELKKSVTEPKKASFSAIDLPKFVGMTVSDVNNTTGLAITSTTSTTTLPKYTIKVTGLNIKDVDDKYVLVGTGIASDPTDTDTFSNGAWDPAGKTDSGLVSTVSKSSDGTTGEISFTFYGKNVDVSAWGNVPTAFTKNHGIFRILLRNDDTDWTHVFLSDTKNEYDSNTDHNIVFPYDIDNDKDYTLTIDLSTYDSSNYTFTLATQESEGSGEYTSAVLNYVIVEEDLTGYTLVNDKIGSWKPSNGIEGTVSNGVTTFDISDYTIEDLNGDNGGFKITNGSDWIGYGDNNIKLSTPSALGKFNVLLSRSSSSGNFTSISYVVAE